MKKAVLVLSVSMVLVCGAVAPVALAQRAAGPVVTVQVKTLTKTLLKPTQARGGTGWITKGHTPPGKCSAKSAAGALNNATHGKWTATYFASVGGIFVDSILGVKPPTKNDFWEVVVNGHVSNLGVCQIKLRAGERLLFKIAKG